MRGSSQSATIVPMPTKTLPSVLKTDPIAAQIYSQREAGGETLLKTLSSRFSMVPHAQLVATLRKLTATGAGRFVVGRRGQKSRFVWASDTAVQPVDESGIQSPKTASVNSSPDMLEYKFPVRPGVLARLFLPDDITVGEVDRLHRLLRAYFKDSE